MKGNILDFSVQQGQGIITTEDGRRYTFLASEWREQDYPQRGQKVDFDVNSSGQAISIYKALNTESSPTFSANEKIKSALSNLDGKSRSSYNIFDWFLLALKNYANFNGRAQRKEYWFYFLIYIIAYFVLSLVDEIFFDASHTGLSIFSGIFVLALLVPTIALATRRLHDIGKSGWWQLLALIPIVGVIILIVWFATKGQEAANAYGPPVVTA